MQRVKVEVEPTRSALVTAMLNSKNNTSGRERLWDTALNFLSPGLFITSPDHLVLLGDALGNVHNSQEYFIATVYAKLRGWGGGN